MSVRDRKIVIYGAGKFGHRMLEFMHSLGVEADYFCQTECEEGGEICGVPVLSFARLCSMKDEWLILIAIGSKTVSRKIKLRLEALFMDQAVVVESGDFLGNYHVKENCVRGGYCVLCNNHIEGFIPGGLDKADKLSIFKEHHIIGGGHRETYSCPVCGGVDRERWQLWVLSKYTEIFREKCRVLHFAPEPHVIPFIESNPNCDYYTGDIVPGRAMHQTDIMDIQYKDEVFDYVIMNHVLEHIEDKAKAMSEVKRVLKPDGKLIISFPICTDQDTLELPDVKTPEERLQQYGQEDHVRLFGRDYRERIGELGFNIEVFTPKKQLAEKEIRYYGFIEDDVLMMCSKQ